ncbi:PREDICTED: uncharacterized protein LOC106104883 isoform X2 [Papilio polytes]|uniref:uncharacterized protein LOC106104883 isoform X2 n=1 Tax=Papilio polytes TaxID=76194 RepID=UPI0006766ED9|nr:PREDICTED: uncharacterized protein LOC106104883 isoform X2 [Papilio polytes]
MSLNNNCREVKMSKRVVYFYPLPGEVDTSLISSGDKLWYEDNHSCVYMGFFKLKDKVFKKILAVIDNDGVTVQSQIVSSPPLGQQFEQEITYVCDDCTVSKVFVNGIPVPTSTRRSNTGSVAFFFATSTSIKIRITEYATTYEGVYQAVFMVGNEEVTKSIMEIKDPNIKSSEALTTAGSAGSEVTTDASGGAADASTDAADASTTG